jgi:hypothetical protein
MSGVPVRANLVFARAGWRGAPDQVGLASPGQPPKDGPET